jgi:hypothetical protein
MGQSQATFFGLNSAPAIFEDKNMIETNPIANTINDLQARVGGLRGYL